MSARLASLLLVLASLAVSLAPATPASASPGDAVAAGAAVAGRLQAGTASCRTLTDAQFEHLGEYVMARMVGSRAAYEAMDRRMEAAIGSPNADRMRRLAGRRYAGCGNGGASSVPAGPGMMGAAGGGWGAMMGGSAWSWMRDGSWRHMSGGEWRRRAGGMMGAAYEGHHGWSTAGIVALVLAALAAGALVAVLVVRRPWRRRPPAAPSAA